MIPAAAAAAAIAAAGTCVWAARRLPSGQRAAWIWLAVAAAGWAIGHVADPLAALVAVPAAAVGLMLSPVAPADARGRMVVVLDAVLFAGSTWLIAWTALGTHRGGPWALASEPGLLLGHLVLGSLAAALQLRIGRATPIWTALLTAGLLARVGADADWLIRPAGVGAGADVLDGIAIVAYVLMAGAAWFVRATPALGGQRTASLRRAVAPYLPIGLAMAVLAAAPPAMGQRVAVWSLFGLLAVLACRQLLTAAENVALGRQLAAALAATSDELRRAGVRTGVFGKRSSEATMVVAEGGQVLYQSPGTTPVLGYPQDALVGDTVLVHAHPDDRDTAQAAFARVLQAPGLTERLICRVRHHANYWIHAEITLSNLLDDPDVAGLVVNVRDVTDRALLRRQVVRHEQRDAATGLVNRRHFLELLQERLAEHPAAVLLIRLHGVKPVADALGHSAADHLLGVIAKRLQDQLGSQGLLARTDSAEFAVLYQQHPNDHVVAAEPIMRAAEEPFLVGGRVVRLRGSAGFASAAAEADATALLHDAAIAADAAPPGGGAPVQVFRPEMRRAAARRHELSEDLGGAIERSELYIEYQPIFTLRDRRLIGMEALVRWRHPTHGAVSPGEFIPLAEERGTIDELDAWVLRTACLQAARWSQRPAAHELTVGVNVSAQELDGPQLLDRVERALADSGLPPDQLLLEITETALAIDPGLMASTLQALRDRGVRLAVDDFGTGYSSLSRLRDLPVEKLKIDRSFVHGLTTAPGGEALVHSIVSMAQSLGLRTVAEGAETAAEWQALGALGCDEVQGFLLSRPLPVEEFQRLLTPPTGALPSPGHRRLTDSEQALARTLQQEGEDLIGTVLTRLATASGMEVAYLSVIEQARACEVIERVIAPEASGWQAGHEVPWPAGLARHVLASGASWTVDAAVDLPDCELAASRRVRAHAGVPVVGPAGQPYGTLCLVSDTPQERDDRILSILGFFAGLVSIELRGHTSAGGGSAEQDSVT